MQWQLRKSQVPESPDVGIHDAGFGLHELLATRPGIHIFASRELGEALARCGGVLLSALPHADRNRWSDLGVPSPGVSMRV